MPALRAKSEQLTGYLKALLNEVSVAHGDLFQIITPADPAQRGCQLSLLVREGGRDLFDGLTKRGVMIDWREPNVIKIAPVPLYNTFEEVHRFGNILKECLR